MFSKLIVIFMVLAPLFLIQSHAYAYIDPGTGSMVVQAILAGIAAVSVSIGVFWKRIRFFFSKMFGKTTDTVRSKDSNER
jgi:hypothetical protein